ncbi:bacillithiol biosynthesis BshC, partial [candidate division KSB1 bacterium]|nr:bacillithiol biosynthesis BshC [candidate division KSB1 bacterium]
MHPHLTFGSVSLVSDYLAGKEQIRPFFNGHFREPSSFSRVADQVRSGRRDVLADILADQNRRCGNLAALPAVELLRHPETRAVVTGQQVGLFGGPLYTLYKALSVIELSGQLNRQLGIPVVPVFYLVSEDHDFQEISWAGWVDRDNRYKRIEYSPVPLPARQPACEIRFDFDIVTMIDGWFKQLPETDFSDQLRQQLLTHYAPTKSFSEAFCGWFSELFKEQGLVLLDAADTRLKPLMQPVIERELRDSIAFSAIAATDRMLQESGYHSQLSVR